MRYLGAALAILLSYPVSSSSLVTGVTNESTPVSGSPDGQVIDTLPAGAFVGVLRLAGEWLQVIYFPTIGAKEMKTGWAALQKIRLNYATNSLSGKCETEFKTGADVCVRVTDTDLDCRKDFTGEQYRGCEVTVHYGLQTNYSGGSYLDVGVECNAEIQYTGRGILTSRSDNESQDESHSLYAHDTRSDSMTLDFSFSYFHEVTKVKIDSVGCEIRHVDLW